MVYLVEICVSSDFLSTWKPYCYLNSQDEVDEFESCFDDENHVFHRIIEIQHLTNLNEDDISYLKSKLY